jgi:hypothetical protein
MENNKEVKKVENPPPPTKQNDGGKGSSPRPIGIDKNTYRKNWDKIFKEIYG